MVTIFLHCYLPIATIKNNLHSLAHVLLIMDSNVFYSNMIKKLIRAAVGDKYVVQKLYEHDLLLGGEQSGHIIMRDYLDSGDGIFTALRVLQTMIQTSNWTMNSFTTYPQVQINIPIYEKKIYRKNQLHP